MPLPQEHYHIHMPVHMHMPCPKKDIHNKTLRTDAQTLGPRNCPAHLAPHTFSGARDGVLVAVAAVKTRRIDLHVPRNGSGEPARAWSQPGTWSFADPCNGFQPG